MRSQEFTTAFRRPQILTETADRILESNEFLTDTTSNSVLFVGRAINQAFIICTFCLGLVGSVVVGVVVGMTSHQLELGLASSTGVIGVIAAIEVLLFWVLK
jgi:hypothetical protein